MLLFLSTSRNLKTTLIKTSIQKFKIVSYLGELERKLMIRKESDSSIINDIFSR